MLRQIANIYRIRVDLKIDKKIFKINFQLISRNFSPSPSHIQLLLEPNKQLPDPFDTAQHPDGVRQGEVFELQQLRQFLDGEFLHAVADVL